ncbi:MAG: M28 family peptidase [candidate division Zixibacteria bacterium]|nr:M28 family peptidase [candidate division Zixibacteria bacterium]
MSGVKSLLCLFFFLFLCSIGVSAADLYKVEVGSSFDAEILNSSQVEPLLRISGGYLILADDIQVSSIKQKKILVSLIQKEITRSEMALEISKRQIDRSDYETIYREGDFVVYRTDPNISWQKLQASFLMPIEKHNIRFMYTEPYALKSSDDYPDDLQGLIDLVLQDSVESYTHTLQAFNGRLTGTASNYASRDWIYNKLVEFGYDSVVNDSFTASISGSPTACQNVVAYKTGTVMPDQYIVVCGHRDAVSGSPGADDNGSGTAGTLEVARILFDIDTDLSFVFILFDAEEQGLHGSWHYSDEAAARGDSIVFVMNMDMIGDIDNSTQAKLYYGAAPGRATLWQELADSLVGINGILSGSLGASDHHPFIQNGYEAILLIENEFSDVYHTPQDSTTHMNFDYHTRMIKGSLATVYTIDQTTVPGPTLAFDYPSGFPETIAPNEAVSFEVVVSGLYDGVPVTETGQIHYSLNSGPWQSDDMVMTSDNRYTATLPATTCSGSLLYYVSAEEQTEGQFNDPSASSPRNPVIASSVISAFTDNFESVQSWAVSGGQWQRGTPTGGGGSYGNPDPSSAHSGSNVFGYNLSGDYANSIPEYHLTSPSIDCTDLEGVTLSFWRWLGVEQPLYDHAYVRISTNGTVWTTLWENTVGVTDNSWLEQEIDISAYADNQPSVYIRWTMGVTDGGWTYCGWNIDDVEVIGYQCDAAYDPLNILTTTVPDGENNTLYEYQLVSEGGLGTHTWVDKNGNLTGTGLGLSTDGVLSGTPTQAGDISFTAEVTDEDSNADEQPFSFTIASSFICGDANSDSEVNIADAVFIVNFAFKGGPEPDPIESGDANCDLTTNVGDAVYIINYVFKGGPTPCCP